MAFVVVHKILARSAVTTRTGLAFIDIDRTVFSFEPGPAHASIIVDQIKAGAAIGARTLYAIVDVMLAESTAEPGRAFASEKINLKPKKIVKHEARSREGELYNYVVNAASAV